MDREPTDQRFDPDVSATQHSQVHGRQTIRLRGVSKTYSEGASEHRVLDRVDLEVAAGEFVVLLGKSGSGKTTLLNLLSGIDQPDSGEIQVANQELTEMNDDQRTLYRRSKVGFVFQSFNLIPTLTVRENVLLPLDLNGVESAEAAARTAELLDQVGLLDRAADLPDRLSGGERQRVAVARALVHEPELVLADEPTGNLDLETGVRVLELLDRLTRKRGRTLVMATHSPEVIGIADRVLTLEHGRFIEAPRRQ